MSTTVTDKFDKHVTGLFKASNSLLQSKGDKKGRASLRNCSRRYNKNKSDFVKQFSQLFTDNNIDILTGTETDEWITDETIYLPYGKKEVKLENKFNFSKVYNLTSRDSDAQLALQYHLYIIFREVSENDDDIKSLDDIIDQLEVKLGLDDVDSEESSSSEEDTGTPDILAGMDLNAIGGQAGNIVGKLLGSLGDLGLDMPEGTKMPPAEEIQKVINGITSNPNSQKVIRKIVNNVQSGGSIEGVIEDDEVKGLLKETLQDTAKMASMAESVPAIEDEGSIVVDDDDPESQM